MAASAICKIKYEAHGQDANKVTVLKDLPINALKKLTQFNIHAVIHVFMPSKTTFDDFLHKRFSEKAYFS